MIHDTPTGVRITGRDTMDRSHRKRRAIRMTGAALAGATLLICAGAGVAGASGAPETTQQTEQTGQTGQTQQVQVNRHELVPPNHGDWCYQFGLINLCI